MKQKIANYIVRVVCRLILKAGPRARHEALAWLCLPPAPAFTSWAAAVFMVAIFKNSKDQGSSVLRIVQSMIGASAFTDQQAFELSCQLAHKCGFGIAFYRPANFRDLKTGKRCNYGTLSLMSMN